jgi:phosphatidylglycerophosphate synthase
MGRALAAVAYRLGLVPNQVTAVSALFTYLGIAVLALVAPGTGMALLVAVALLLGYALDSADGQLARLTGLGRPSGEWLDHVIDMGKVCLLHGAVAISWVRWGVPGFEAGAWAVGIPVIFLAVSVVAFFGWLLSDLLVRLGQARRQTGDASIPPSMPKAQPAPALRSLLRVPSDYGLLALTFAWFAAPLFAATYTLLLVANFVILMAALPVWFRQVRASEEIS